MTPDEAIAVVKSVLNIRPLAAATVSPSVAEVLVEEVERLRKQIDKHAMEDSLRYAMGKTAEDTDWSPTPNIRLVSFGDAGAIGGMEQQWTIKATGDVEWRPVEFIHSQGRPRRIYVDETRRDGQ